MSRTRKKPIKRDHFELRCFSCKEKHEIDSYGKFYTCRKCGGLLEVRRFSRWHSRDGSEQRSRLGVWRYLDLIPVWSPKNIVSLSEGGTTLVRCKNLESIFGISSLYVKFEGLNPTGSFKDRGMTVGISKAVELGFRSVMCASTGNTSASLAAYSARAGLRCMVLVPKGKIAMGKIAQAIAYGAEIYQVDGNFDDSLRIATEFCGKNSTVLLLNSLNPFRIEGQKTLAFEITEQLGGILPGSVVLPVGNGGNISSVWKGFSEILDGSLGRIFRMQRKGRQPRLIGIQAEGAAPIAKSFKENRRDITPVVDPHTEASAINIGSPVSWMKALAAIYDSKGSSDFVSDEEIFEAQRLLASKEGLFVEPASAAPIAYLSKISREKLEEYERMKNSLTVCICTGNGLKDPNAMLRGVEPSSLKTIPNDATSFTKLLSGEQAQILRARQ